MASLKDFAGIWWHSSTIIVPKLFEIFSISSLRERDWIIAIVISFPTLNFWFPICPISLFGIFRKFWILSIHWSNNCFLWTMINAGWHFWAIISSPIIVFPEPGGDTITPKSLSIVLLIAASWFGINSISDLKSTGSSFFLLSTILKGRFSFLQNVMRLATNPLGIIIPSGVSSTNLKYFSRLNVDLPIFFFTR